MVQRFCTSGNHEAVKCAVHAAAGLLVGACAAYNITASFYRRDRHLRFNSVLYTLVFAWELKQALHHLDAIPCRASDELKPAA